MTPPKFVLSWLNGIAISLEAGVAITTVFATLLVIIISIIAFYISRRVVNIILHRIVERNQTTRKNILVKNNLFNRLTYLVPALVAQFFIPIILAQYAQIEAVADRIILLYFLIVAIIVIDALINVLHCLYQTLKISQEIPLTGFYQVLKIVLYFVGVILIISVIFNQTPVFLFSGLGAMTALLILIFKDPIVGFVAGIQLISNRMLRQGDWLEMPKYGADGDVMEINLTTVKVRNFDRTITTIPTYALISDSFKNWRGMQESGGRRIKRAINIDMGTIKFCTPEMLEQFEKIRHITDYMQKKKKELDNHNATLGIEALNLANCRRLTNIGTFRAYVKAYLHNHPMINNEMTFIVRQLAPNENGLPLEICVFCKDKVWANYEAVQSDIFDHLLAIVPAFELQVFQHPSSRDLSNMHFNAMAYRLPN